MSESCLFCDIAVRRIAASVVYEDDDVMAFLDINPLAPGHVLLITKAHCETLLRCAEKHIFGPVFCGTKDCGSSDKGRRCGGG